MNAKSILEAVRILRKAPEDQVTKVIKDLSLTEAAKADGEHLSAAEEVKDLYSDYHATPTREEINVGPAEAASGDGADKMIREYSNLAPQIGVQIDYERVAGMMGEMVKAQKAQTDAIQKQSKLLVYLVEAAVKKATDEEAKDEDEDDDEEKTASKARSITETLLKKADETFDKIDQLTLKLATAKTAKTKKVIQSRIDSLTTEAESILAKARRGVIYVNDASLTDAFNEIALKGDTDLVDDKEDDDEEEKKSAKKAETVDQQADGQDDHGNQPAESETSKGLTDRVEKALAGIQVMHGEVKDIFNAISNTSRGKTVSTAALVKNQAALVEDDDKIFDRMSKKVLSADEANMCDNLIQLKSLVKGGARSQRDFDDAVKKTPDAVQEIFA